MLARSPLARKTSLRAKPKRKNTALRRYHSWVAQQGCLVSGESEVTLHHPTAHGDRMGRVSRDDWLVVPLAARFHLIQHGPHTSVEALGHRGFYQTYGIDLLEAAKGLRDRYEDENG